MVEFIWFLQEYKTHKGQMGNNPSNSKERSKDWNILFVRVYRREEASKHQDATFINDEPMNEVPLIQRGHKRPSVNGTSIQNNHGRIQ